MAPNKHTIPTEPIGSVPRPAALREAAAALAAGTITTADYDSAVDAAVKETIEQFEATGSPVVTDGEQAKSSFATYTLERLDNIAPDDVALVSTGRYPRLHPGAVSRRPRHRGGRGHSQLL